MNKLQRAIAANWTDALRSGQYKQGYEKLTYCETTYHDDGTATVTPRYCCLGVLNHLLGGNINRGSVGIDEAAWRDLGLPIAQQVLMGLNDGENLAQDEYDLIPVPLPPRRGEDNTATFEDIADFIDALVLADSSDA